MGLHKIYPQALKKWPPRLKVLLSAAGFFFLKWHSKRSLTAARQLTKHTSLKKWKKNLENCRLLNLIAVTRKITSGDHLDQYPALEQVAQDLVQSGFEYLQGWSQPLWQPVPVFNHAFLTFKWNYLYSKCCPFPPVLSLDTTEKSLALASLLLCI